MIPNIRKGLRTSIDKVLLNMHIKFKTDRIKTLKNLTGQGILWAKTNFSENLKI